MIKIFYANKHLTYSLKLLSNPLIISLFLTNLISSPHSQPPLSCDIGFDINNERPEGEEAVGVPSSVVDKLKDHQVRRKREMKGIE